jgi:hypothetical protein
LFGEILKNFNLYLILDDKVGDGKTAFSDLRGDTFRTVTSSIVGEKRLPSSHVRLLFGGDTFSVSCSELSVDRKISMLGPNNCPLSARHRDLDLFGEAFPGIAERKDWERETMCNN